MTAFQPFAREEILRAMEEAPKPVSPEPYYAHFSVANRALMNRCMEEESRAATRAGEAGNSDVVEGWSYAEYLKAIHRAEEAEKERDHWKAKAEQPSACPTSICAAAKRDDVTCADDSCDIETGVRKSSAPCLSASQRRIDEYHEQPSAAGGDEIERVARAIQTAWSAQPLCVTNWEEIARAAMKALAGGGGGE